MAVVRLAPAPWAHEASPGEALTDPVPRNRVDCGGLAVGENAMSMRTSW